MKTLSCELTWMKRGLSETCYMFFRVLANPARLAILEALRDEPKSVNEIAVNLKQEQSMISHNLAALERCRFVSSERKEKQRIYSLNNETMEPLFKLFKHNHECRTHGRCLTEEGLRQTGKSRLPINFM
jgi:DNA-binding transcriptional ArsR family regulator